MSDHKAFDNQIQDVNKCGRICQQFAVTVDDGVYSSWEGRSRAERIGPTDKTFGRVDKGVFSILVPGERSVKQNAVILQYHGNSTEDSDKPNFIGVPFCVQAFPEHIRFIRGIEQPTPESPDSDFANSVSKQFVPDVWQDFHFDIKWTDQENGYIKFWLLRGDEQIMIFSYTGSTCTNEAPYMKWGIHHPSWSDGVTWDKVYSTLRLK